MVGRHEYTCSGFLSRHNDMGFYIFTFLPEGTRAGVHIISFDIELWKNRYICLLYDAKTSLQELKF